LGLEPFKKYFILFAFAKGYVCQVFLLVDIFQPNKNARHPATQVEIVTHKTPLFDKENFKIEMACCYKPLKRPNILIGFNFINKYITAIW